VFSLFISAVILAIVHSAVVADTLDARELSISLNKAHTSSSDVATDVAKLFFSLSRLLFLESTSLEI
jgi:hypothetical protein